jgi:hypothetical protein
MEGGACAEIRSSEVKTTAAMIAAARRDDFMKGSVLRLARRNLER